MYKNIFIDQCGYQPQMKKYVTFQAQEPVEFSVLRSDGECVMKGSTDKRFENASAKEIDYIGDFSKLTTPGRYYIVAKGLGESDTFEIREDVYADTFQKAMYFFYLQRCGCELPESAAGAYAHGACHTQDAVIYGTQNKISVNGGWHDAGDYGRYVVPGAMAVRFYQKYDAEYADRLAAASRRAYEALQNMNIPGGFKNPEEIVTGEYGDPCDEDERYWAAAELYKTFGDEKYRRDFEERAAGKIYHGYGWGAMGSYGNLAYITTSNPVSEELKEKIKASMIDLGRHKLEIEEVDGYGTALASEEYTWGSNMNTANNGLHLYDAYRLTGQKEYLDAAAQQLHYLLGRNPMGLSYLTGCGTDAIKHPHHRPSCFVGRAMPGMLSGGPCNWLADETVKEIFDKDIAPAKALADMTGSYSTNEVTIYWNSAFIQLLASVTEQ